MGGFARRRQLYCTGQGKRARGRLTDREKKLSYLVWNFCSPAIQVCSTLVFPQIRGGNIEDILVDHDKICPLARFEAADNIILMGRIGGIYGKGGHRLLQSHGLFRHPTFIRLIVAALTGNRRVNAIKRIGQFNGKIRTCRYRGCLVSRRFAKRKPL